MESGYLCKEFTAMVKDLKFQTAKFPRILSHEFAKNQHKLAVAYECKEANKHQIAATELLVACWINKDNVPIVMAYAAGNAEYYNTSITKTASGMYKIEVLHSTGLNMLSSVRAQPWYANCRDAMISSLDVPMMLPELVTSIRSTVDSLVGIPGAIDLIAEAKAMHEQLECLLQSASPELTTHEHKMRALRAEGHCMFDEKSGMPLPHHTCITARTPMQANFLLESIRNLLELRNMLLLNYGVEVKLPDPISQFPAAIIRR